MKLLLSSAGKECNCFLLYHAARVNRFNHEPASHGMSQLLAFDIGAVIGSTFFVVHNVDENNINGVHLILLTIVIRYFKLLLAH